MKNIIKVWLASLEQVEGNLQCILPF